MSKKKTIFEEESVIIEPFAKNFTPYDIIEKCCLGKYLIKYLNRLNAKTGIIEGYIDKDFLIDFQNFYCRSFENYRKITKRIHFFSQNINEEDFKKFISDFDEENIKELQDIYLGFVVIKPVKDHNDKWLVGRTLLETISDPNKLKNILVKYNVSLFGIPLEVNTLPFQTQDQRVSACATIALWTAINPLSNLFDTMNYSPSEITELSASYPSNYRIFPSSGLTWQQMLNCIKSVGLDIEVIDVAKYRNDDIFTNAVKAYIQTGIPLIAGLILEKPGGKKDLHAVVISGYRFDNNGVINEMFVHDDQIGPYSSVFPNPSFKNWENEWSKNGIYINVSVDKIMVPVYHKIRLTYVRMYALYEHINQKLEQISSKVRSGLQLTTVQSYKKFLLKKRFKNKKEILLKLLPRFLWLIQIYNDDKRIRDLVFDATSILPNNPIVTIHYS